MNRCLLTIVVLFYLWWLAPLLPILALIVATVVFISIAAQLLMPP